MASFSVGGRAAEEMCDALKKRKKFVEISSMSSIQSLIDEAYKLEPRLTGCVVSWKGQQSRNGLLGLNKNYSIELEYAENLPADINDVVLDDGKWTPSQALATAASMPDAIQVVTNDLDSLKDRIEDEVLLLKEKYPGLKGVTYKWLPGAGSGYATMWVDFTYFVERERYKMYTTLASRELERIDRSHFGNGNIPKLIKVFLVFSYLQQTCTYDQESADLLDADQSEMMDRPFVSIPYGALVKKMAVCEGIAGAFKMFMDYFGIPNRIVFGSFDGEKVNHCWNMVCLNEKYYHVDATYGISGDGIYIGTFLKDDLSMSETHFWDMSKYPQCTSRRLDDDYVENYISEHIDDLLDMGVDDRILCPEEIRE